MTRRQQIAVCNEHDTEAILTELVSIKTDRLTAEVLPVFPL